MGILSDLLSGDVNVIIYLLYQIPVVLIALTMHEVAHGYVAMKCGDPTAQMLGRLSLNPLHHLDLFGTISMFLFGIGWAKPVPVNPRNYKNFRRDDILVSFAGIATNLILFFISCLLMVLVQQVIYTPEFFQKFYYAFWPENYHAQLAPLSQAEVLSIKGNFVGLTLANDAMTHLADLGLTEYVRAPWLMYVQRFLMYFSITNLSLAVFNLLPIPPLDGYHLFNDVLFRGKLRISANVARGISMAFMLLLVFTPYVGNALSIVTNFVHDKVISFLLMIFGGL